MKSLVATLLVSVAIAANPAAANETSKGVAPPTDAALIEGAGFAPDDVGYLVVDLADKRILAEHNPDKSSIPASVAKIFTIAAALEILGGDHRFATTLDAVGEVSNGVLTGSLTLRGGGDPFLTGDDLRAMAKQVTASGIKVVNGSFFYDASASIEVPQIDATAAGGRGLQHRRQRTLRQLQPSAPRLERRMAPILRLRLPRSATILRCLSMPSALPSPGRTCPGPLFEPAPRPRIAGSCRRICPQRERIGCRSPIRR